MSLQAAIQAELPFLRAQAESRMVSTAVVRRKTGTFVQNETTGQDVPEWVEVYDGPFRLGGSDSGSSQSKVESPGGVTIQSASRVGHFPYDTSDLADGDLIDIIDGENAGVVLRIVEADWQDQATARRVPVLSAQRPPEWTP